MNELNTKVDRDQSVLLRMAYQEDASKLIGYEPNSSL